MLVIFVRFLFNLNILDTFSNNTQMSNFMKIRLASNDLFQADGRTDGQTVTKLIVTFHKFAKASKHAIHHSRYP